jgi:triacylglycerol lipase
VVLVSGFDTTTPFTTSAPACAGEEGATWSAPTGPAAALKQAGYTVFTAPVAREDGSPGAPCTDGGPAPPASATIDSNNGDLDGNGRALLAFLAFLRTSYGVTSVQLVGHSDGGMWSRAAITQFAGSGAGVTVQSLMTLGSPLTGSFGADLAEYISDGRCEASNEVERLVCQAMLAAFDALLADLGPTAIREATSAYLAGWNPRQSIGCPVTVAAGTYVRIPVIGFLIPDYYSPSDGVVGEASALGRASRSLDLTPIPAPGIPHIVVAGTFPVVHSSVLGFLSANTLTNYAAVAAAVVGAVGSGASGPACAAPVAAAAHAARATSARRPGSAAQAARTRLRVPLRYLRVADRSGRLDRPRRGDLALLLPGAAVRCGTKTLRARPVLGSRRLRFVVPRCARRPRTRGRVLLLRRDGHRRALHAERLGRRLNLRLSGPPLHRVRARVRIHERWRRIGLGTSTLSARAGAIAVRVTGFDRRGEGYAAIGYLAP